MSEKAAIIINLGSPDSYQTKDVKKYLGEFLMDPRVIDIKEPFRSLLVKGIILNTRPRKSAKLYQSIWWDEGSPLIVYTQRLLNKVQSFASVSVTMAMRYGNPSIKNTIDEMIKNNPNLKQLYIVPLYPHYAMSSYETVVEMVKTVVAENYPHLQLKFKKAFYNNSDYLSILSKSIEPFLKQDYDHILFSYHGIPERHLRKTNPTKNHCLITENCCAVKSIAHDFCYRHQCVESTNRVAEILGIPKDKYSFSFQSRLGRDPWLKPYTDQVLEEFPKKGVKKLLIVTPAFVSDCLETIEEIAEEGKEEFLVSGGEEFTAIPCLNENDDWAKLLANWIDNEED